MGNYNQLKVASRITKITITRVLEDDTYHGAPDEDNEGFWPSKDENAPGYCPPEHFEKSMATAKQRMAQFKAGQWNYVGVRAMASIFIPIGQGSICEYKLLSAGLWGIESDSGEKYLNEVFEEQAAELVEHIKQFASAPITIKKE